MAEPIIAVIAQARMGSSRLPGKVLKQVAGASLLEHLVTRVQLAETPLQLVIATTTAPADQAIADEAARLNVPCFKGPEEDVLERYAGASAMIGADVVVRVTGDCPLLDPSELDRVINVYLNGLKQEEPWQFVRNQAGMTRRIPHGHDVEVFSAELLRQASVHAIDPGDREHVTPYFYRVEGRFKALVTDPPGPDYSALRLTVDTPSDLTFVETLMDALGPNADAKSIYRWLASNPDAASINALVDQRGFLSAEQHRAERVRGKTLLARADAGQHIGFGHAARIEALLDAWAELGGRAVLFGSGIEGAIRKRLEQAGVTIIDKPGLPPEAMGTLATVEEAGFEDLAQTLAIAEREEAVAIATDGYAFQADYLRELANALPLLAIDDLADFPCKADVVINQNMGFDAERYDVSSATALLVGHEFVLFRREFRDVAKKSHSHDTLDEAGSSSERRILLTFGGTDPARLTLPVVSSLLAALQPADKIVAIIGSGLPAEDQTELAKLCEIQHAERANLSVLTDVESMAEVFAGATMAITAAGSTTWELIVCGVPPLAVSVADNQRAVAKGMASRGAGINLGWHASLTADEITQKILSILDNDDAKDSLKSNGRALIDGKGVWRAIDALLNAMEQRKKRR